MADSPLIVLPDPLADPLASPVRLLPMAAELDYARGACRDQLRWAGLRMDQFDEQLTALLSAEVTWRHAWQRDRVALLRGAEAVETALRALRWRAIDLAAIAGGR